MHDLKVIALDRNVLEVFTHLFPGELHIFLHWRRLQSG
jgi:hypothetical protein